MFGTVVMEIPHHHFEKAMHDMKVEVGAKEDSDLSGTHLRVLTARYKEIYKQVLLHFSSLLFVNLSTPNTTCLPVFLSACLSVFLLVAEQQGLS